MSVEKRHARLSASNAEYWSQCPARPWLTERYGSDDRSAAAEFGTAVHWLSEQTPPLAQYVGHKASNGEVITPTMLGMAEDYLEWLTHIKDVYGVRATDAFQEVPVPLTTITREDSATGTADFLATSADGSTLIVVDLKTGAYTVDAKHNKQLMLYANGALQICGKPNIDKVVMCIVQPAKDDASFERTRFNVEIISVNELRLRLKEVSAAANKCWEALADDEGLVRGDYCKPSQSACKWCPAIHACPSIKREVEDAFANVKIDFAEEEALVSLWKMIPTYRKFFDAVEAAVEKKMVCGVPMPGLKLVSGKEGNRRWGVDEDTVVARFAHHTGNGDQVYKKVLISPTDMEKFHKDVYKLMSDCVTRSPGKPTVVPETDPRPALVSDATFDSLD